jgi:hypothetical protein
MIRNLLKNPYSRSITLKLIFTQFIRFFLALNALLIYPFFHPLAAEEKSKPLKLKGSISATTVHQTTTYYNWSLSKTFNPHQTPFIIRPGKTVPATFTISIRRSNGYQGAGIGPLTGQVCVTNSDTQPTQNLHINTMIQVQGAGGFQDIATQDIPVGGELGAGGSRCFFFIYNNLAINAVQNYRAIASISSSNVNNSLRKPSEISVAAPVMIQNQSKSLDETAILKDFFECPPGFLCTPLEFTQTYSGPRTLSYQVILTNQSASCAQTLTAKNTAKLTGITSQYSQTASTVMRISTGNCIPHR